MAFSYDEESLRALDPEVLRALLREATHHGVETRLYPSLNGKKAAFETPAKLKKILGVYESLGYDVNRRDVQWAKQIVSLAEAWREGIRPEFEGHRPVRDEQLLKYGSRLIYGRRSIRQWTDQPVDGKLLREIVKAGTYAPCACLVQGTRYLVLDSPEDLAVIKSREFSGEMAKIITLVDRRPFEVLAHIPQKNLLLDAGASMQNMLLMAEALGLAAVWGTLNEREVQEVKDYFRLPDYYDVIAYISLGYADEGVLTPGRISLDEAIVNQ